ncbi:uncharacterized protein LOC141902848 [Tubulanus polymorphus]|uniref:uncharacterized protein LOC141902848 n=1 Tax=Tubulanus polymorphus TaxID=672921 RepID=UPI003DA27181
MSQSGGQVAIQPQSLSPTLLNNGRMTSSSQYMTNLGNSMNRGFMTSSPGSSAVHAMNHGYSSYVPSHQNMAPGRIQNGLSEIKGEPKDNMLMSENNILANDCTAFKPVMKL